MLIEIPVIWLITINVLAWPVIQMAVAWWATQLPAEMFDPQSSMFRPRTWEKDGDIYTHTFAIKKWKELLPDAATWFQKGFPKKTLTAADANYLARFIQETCRGEAAHWVMMGATPLFFLWNPWWADLIMIAYAVMANLPCILTQRYNRLRLTRSLSAQSSRTRFAHPSRPHGSGPLP